MYRIHNIGCTTTTSNDDNRLDDASALVAGTLIECMWLKWMETNDKNGESNEQKPSSSPTMLLL